MAPSIKTRHNFQSRKATNSWLLCCFGCSSVDRSMNCVVNQPQQEEACGNCNGNGSWSGDASKKENNGTEKKKKIKKRNKKYLKFAWWPLIRVRASRKSKLELADNDDRWSVKKISDDVQEAANHDLAQASPWQIKTGLRSSTGIVVAGVSDESTIKLSFLDQKKKNPTDRQTTTDGINNVINRGSATHQQKQTNEILFTNRPEKRKYKDARSSSQNRTRRPSTTKIPDSQDPVIGMSILTVTLVIMVSCGPLCAILCTSAWFYCIPWLVKANNNNGNHTLSDSNNNKSSSSKRRDEKSEMMMSSELYRKKVVFDGFCHRDRRL